MNNTFLVTSHTDHIDSNSTFIVQDGFKDSGLKYLSLAMKKGAKKIVIPNKYKIEAQKIITENLAENLNIKYVEDCRLELSKLSAEAYDFPSLKLKIIGITGTKGKTSSTFLLYHMLKKLGYKVGLISGVHCQLGDEVIKSNLTTPQADFINWFLDKAVKNNYTHIVMEVSAQAITLKRVAHINFYGGLFTNFSSEHLEFYNNLDEYFQAKSQLINLIDKDGFFIINGDEDHYFKLNLKLREKVKTFSILNGDYKYNIENSNPVIIKFNNFTFKTNLIGSFNAINLAGIISILISMNLDISKTTNLLDDFKGVPGRMESYKLKNNSIAIIDYAHNPSSYASFFPTVRTLTKNLIAIFGCGGERDSARRPIMGEIASKYADQIILTTDNPRSEDAQKIAEEILSGIPIKEHHKVIIILDRAAAIKKAYELSYDKSLIALLGKGPDEYQEIGQNKFFFSDFKELANYF